MECGVFPVPVGSFGLAERFQMECAHCPEWLPQRATQCRTTQVSAVNLVLAGLANHFQFGPVGVDDPAHLLHGHPVAAFQVWTKWTLTTMVFPVSRFTQASAGAETNCWILVASPLASMKRA